MTEPSASGEEEPDRPRTAPGSASHTKPGRTSTGHVKFDRRKLAADAAAQEATSGGPAGAPVESAKRAEPPSGTLIRPRSATHAKPTAPAPASGGHAKPTAATAPASGSHVKPTPAPDSGSHGKPRAAPPSGSLIRPKSGGHVKPTAAPASGSHPVPDAPAASSPAPGSKPASASHVKPGRSSTGHVSFERPPTGSHQRPTGADAKPATGSHVKPATGSHVKPATGSHVKPEREQRAIPRTNSYTKPVPSSVPVGRYAQPPRAQAPSTSNDLSMARFGTTVGGLVAALVVAVVMGRELKPVPPVEEPPAWSYERDAAALAAAAEPAPPVAEQPEPSKRAPERAVVTVTAEAITIGADDPLTEEVEVPLTIPTEQFDTLIQELHRDDVQQDYWLDLVDGRRIELDAGTAKAVADARPFRMQYERADEPSSEQ